MSVRPTTARPTSPLGSTRSSSSSDDDTRQARAPARSRRARRRSADRRRRTTSTCRRTPPAAQRAWRRAGRAAAPSVAAVPAGSPTSLGLAMIVFFGTDSASSTPLRSKIVPRSAGRTVSLVRCARPAATSPCACAVCKQRHPRDDREAQHGAHGEQDAHAATALPGAGSGGRPNAAGSCAVAGRASRPPGRHGPSTAAEPWVPDGPVTAVAPDRAAWPSAVGASAGRSGPPDHRSPGAPASPGSGGAGVWRSGARSSSPAPCVRGSSARRARIGRAAGRGSRRRPGDRLDPAELVERIERHGVRIEHPAGRLLDQADDLRIDRDELGGRRRAHPQCGRRRRQALGRTQLGALPAQVVVLLVRVADRPLDLVELRPVGGRAASGTPRRRASDRRSRRSRRR